MKKGQSFPLVIMSALAVLVLGLMFVNFLFDPINNARADLNCSSADTIHDGNKILCLVVDVTVPYVIISIFSVLTGVIIARMTT